jgi:hypothetical protein
MASLVIDVDDDLNPRQKRRQRSPVDPALVSPSRSFGGRRLFRYTNSICCD